MSKVCIFGLQTWENYGQKLAELTERTGHSVYAYDEDINYVVTLKRRKEDTKIKYYYDFNTIPLCAYYVICVPPDMVRDAVSTVCREVGDPMGRSVIVESTLTVGRTRAVVSPLVNKGFHVCYSPRHHLDCSKVLAGVDNESVEHVRPFYMRLYKNVQVARSIEVAEGARMLVGLYRAVNTALANEFSEICKRIDLDPYEVIDLAAESEGPKRYHAFSPWVGIGGDSSEDPMKAIMLKKTPLISTTSSHIINRPLSFVESLPEEMNITGPFLVVGVGYKPYSSSWESSPVVEFLTHLNASDVYYWDPYVDQGFPHAKWIDVEAAMNKGDWEGIFIFHPYMLSAWESTRANNKFHFCQTKIY